MGGTIQSPARGGPMIHLHRLNDQEVPVNAELIETVEGHPDGVSVLATGNRLGVKVCVTGVVPSVGAYRQAGVVFATRVQAILGEMQRLAPVAAAFVRYAAAWRQLARPSRRADADDQCDVSVRSGSLQDESVAIAERFARAESIMKKVCHSAMHLIADGS